MKLHSDIVDKAGVTEAFRIARRADGQDIYEDAVRQCGSRSRRYGVEFYAESAHGKRARNGRDGAAASWTAYGYVIARLFQMDPEAIIGSYKGADDFAAQCRRYTPRGESLAFLDLLSDES